MPSFYLLGCITAIALSIVPNVSGSPTPHLVAATSLTGNLLTRALDGYDDCSDDQKKKLGQGFADAATLARWVFDHPIDKSSTAFTHYLRNEDESPAKQLWDTIQQNNDPTNALFHFRVRCSKGGNECPKGSLAITDATPRSGNAVPQMLICPLFFTIKETQNSLDSKEYKKNPGRRDNSWCKPGQKFSDFETAGHTLLHEMTHLDAVGAAAGLSVRHGTHGTDDVSGLGNNYQPAARALKKLWDDGKAGTDTLKPSENAESIAAAATEWYFLDRCGFHEITS